jgi:hypothetical protein
LFEEANAELEEIDPFYRRLPETLLSRLAIYHGLEKWEPLAVVAKKLADRNPKEPGYFVELAYATKRAESIHGGGRGVRDERPVESHLALEPRAVVNPRSRFRI